MARAGNRFRGARDSQLAAASAARFRSDPMGFVTNTLPYISRIRDYFNSSIQGNGVYYGLPMWLIWLLRITFSVLAAASVWLLYKYYRERDPLFWMATTSGVLLTTRGWCCPLARVTTR